MRKPYDNLFVYYRGPSVREGADVGRQLEDNTTKAFLNTLEKSGGEVAEGIVSELLPPAVNESIEPDELNFRTQVTASDEELRKRETFLLGLSNNDKERFDDDILVSDRQGTADDTSSKRYDAVIEIRDDVALVIEVKTQSDNFEKIDEYVPLLGITEHAQYDFVNWLSVNQKLQEFQMRADVGSVSNILVDQFRELLQYNAPSRTVEVLPWDEEGENSFEIERGAEMKVSTKYAENKRVPFAVKIDISGRSEEIYFTPAEWEQLIDDLDAAAIQGFVNGKFDYFEKEYKKENKLSVLAQIGSYPEPRKRIQVSKSNGDVVVGYRRRGEDSDTWNGRYPMMAQWEFEKFYGDGDEGLTRAECKSLFEQGDLTALLPEDWSGGESTSR